MSNMEIRWATIEDFLEIAELDRVSWRHNRNSEFIPDGEHVWRHWVEHAYVCVAIESKKIIGVALSFPSTTLNIHLVHKIFLVNDCRGKGIGKKMMIKICDKFDQNILTAKLTIDTNNKSMQRLAESMQFSEKELIKGYYRDNEDRWVYTRKPC